MNIKKLFTLLLAVSMVSYCFSATAYAGNQTADESLAVVSVDSETAVEDAPEGFVEIGRASVPGISVASDRSGRFMTSASVPLTVPSGYYADAVGFKIVNRTDPSATGDIFTISPSLLNGNTVPCSSQMYYFNIIRLNAGRSVTYTITHKTGEHFLNDYEAAVILYQKVN